MNLFIIFQNNLYLSHIAVPFITEQDAKGQSHQDILSLIHDGTQESHVFKWHHFRIQNTYLAV